MKLGFKNFHPTVQLLFYIFTFILCLTSTHPIVLVFGLILSLGYDIKLREKKAVSFFFKFTLPLMTVSTLFNGLFSHYGETVFFTTLNGTNFTLEALIYGLIFSLRAGAMITWINTLNETLTNDRIIFLFGKISPKIALIISMALRFIPLIALQSSQINTSQKGIGNSVPDSFAGKIKNASHRLSILVSWTLERGIDTASSMKARGYGLKGRTVYNPFKFFAKDIVFSIFIFAATVLFVISKNTLSASFNPTIELKPLHLFEILCIVLFVFVMVFPLIYDLYEEKKWLILK